MAIVTGFTADRMREIEAGTIVSARKVGDFLILTTHAGVDINVGSIMGAAGPIGPEGPDGPMGYTGLQGVPGPTGADGLSRYTWIKYADSPVSGMSDLPQGKNYMGIATNKLTATESSTYSDYNWALTVGQQGTPGAIGPNGDPTYTWIKYATSITGEDMSDSPIGRSYLGLAYNKTTQLESNIPDDYAWSYILGPQGEVGANGDDAVLLRLSSTRGTSFKNSSIATVLTVVVFKGSQRIATIQDLHDTFGTSSYLEWWWRRKDDAAFGVISSADNRLSQSGFALTVSPADVDEQSVFECRLQTAS